ncbi:ribbon-helix-helix domain-containing protein [Marivita hallyeonensis]|uniref:Antitoxin ParD1/3/4 n=1 Tax=Marivita hallyeonensis TaxID=996342 RepID=A0A1M5Y1K3_9RHOB|nr:type II toxin-antitoxin system ParD family antitoxin [Marivita hallyeonensis]SHI05882.1 antitoxin ParD1/3/4 [Marivita hallyeonensis]
MSVKASVSMSEQQEAFARSLVEEGKFSSVSAVVQHSLDLLKTKTELEEAELNALRSFFADRRDGGFETTDAARSATRDMITRKRRAHGL